MPQYDFAHKAEKALSNALTCHGLGTWVRDTGASVRRRGSRQRIGLAKTLVQESERESQDSYRACQSHQTWPIAWRMLWSPFTLAVQKRKVASYLKMITEARLGKAYLVAEKTEERLKRLRPHDPSDLDSDIPTKRGVSARKGKECHGGKREERPLGSRASSVSKHEDAVMSSQGMLEATIAHQGEPVLEVERLKGDVEGMSERDTFSHEDEESLHEEQEELTIDEKWAYLMEGLAFHTQRFIKLEEISTSWEQRVGRLEQAEDEAKQTQGVVESRLDRLESMEDRFKVETQRVIDELEMVRGRNAQEAEVAALKSEVDELKRELLICKGAMSEWGALKTFLEGLRPGAMLRGEQGDAQRFSEAIAVAGTPTELADVKTKSDVSSRPMPRDSGNNGGDREMVQRGDGIESSSSGQVEPSTVRGQGKPSGKNGKAKSGENKKASKETLKCYFCDGPHLIRGFPEKRCLTTIMERMGEGGVASIGGGIRVQAAKSRERLGPIDGINAAKQGDRQGKAIDVETAKPRRKPDAIANDRAIKSGARLDEATCSKVVESRGKHGATTSSQVVKPGLRRDETAGVKAIEHRKGPGAIASDKAVKPRVQSEQVRSQYAKMEAWSKLRCLRHKGTLKEYAKRALERREVKELSEALTTAESIKEFGVKKNKTSKPKPRAEGSGKRSRNEGKSKDEECCSSSGRESPLNDEPDGGSGNDVCTSSSDTDAKPRVRIEQEKGRKLEVPTVLRDYPRGAESSKVTDEPRIELSKEEDKPRIEGALRLGSIRFISAKASRGQGQTQLSMSKESKQGLAEDVQERNNPSKTRRQESKEAKTLRDKATVETPPISKVGQNLTLNADGTKFGWDPRLCRKGQGGPSRGKSRLVGRSSYGRDALQAKASKGNQVDVKYGARDREVTCGRSQGKQFVWEDRNKPRQGKVSRVVLPRIVEGSDEGVAKFSGGECHGIGTWVRDTGASVRRRGSRQRIGLAKTLVQESERESQDSYRACQSHQTWPIAWRMLWSPFTLAVQKRKVASYLKMITEARLGKAYLVAEKTEERLKRLRLHDPSNLDSDIPTVWASKFWGRDKWYQSESLWESNDRFNRVFVEGASRKRGVSARKGKECHGGKREERPLGSRASSVSKHEDAVMSSQGMLEATIAHQGEPVLEVERLKGDAEGMSERDTFSHEDEESLHEEQEELTIDEKWAYLMEGLAFHTQRFIKLEEISTSWEQRVGRLEQAEDEAKQTQGVVESRLDRLESMEGRFKVET
ncbi:hypothetical protein F3Y22_tig00110943pilonHSYRG00145 [Hibiscus syriacus]|uniref:Uncharacterized protein n=1 Tax=Hibiscus syriacus TaxID=106335 RepID=A0A6A2ZAU7_HIBSY|nr:hypothetical protein F3Y22_tig00110943pilonHSYRG00145 [Hibiscus syriacus]